jgi:hypothetical protein
MTAGSPGPQARGAGRPMSSVLTRQGLVIAVRDW